MKKPWVLFTVVVVACLALLGAAALVANQFAKNRKEAEARRQQEAEDELARQRAADRVEAAVTFTESAPPAPEEAAAFIEVLQKFRDAHRAENGSALVEQLDPERLFDELVIQGGPALAAMLKPADRASFVRGFRLGAQNMIANPLMDWDTTVIRRVRWSPDQREAVVIATHRGTFKFGDEETPVTMKMRWWFINRSGQWKLYDMESLDESLRMTSTLAELIRKDNLPRLGEFRQAMLAFKDAVVAMQAGNLDEFDAKFAECRRFPFPNKMNATLLVIEAVAHMFRGKPEEAMACVDRAAELNPDMPLRHYIRMCCLNSLADYEGALKASEAYFAQLGGDEDFYVQQGIALEGLGREAEAATAYRKSLDEAPDEKDALDGLRRVLPKEQLAELGERLAKVRDPGKLFDELTRLARVDDDDAAVVVYETAFRKLRPNDPRGITACIRRLVDAKKFAEAATEMKAGLDRVKAEEQSWVVNAYLFAMLEADRVVEAYRAVPAKHTAAAFRLLADDLEELMEGEEENDKPAKQLRELLAAHKKQFPTDPWVGYFEGVLLQSAKEYAKAERAFAAAQTAYLKTPRIKKGDEDDEDWEAGRFRSRRVDCFLALKQGAKAYAEVGPVRDTFVQLAHAYEQSKDWESLETMIARHRKAEPGDRNGPYWAANVLYLRGKYADAATAFSKYLADAKDEDHNAWIATDRCVRAYLRTGQTRDARLTLMKFGADRGGLGLRAAVALAEGRVAEVEEIIAEHAKTGGTHGFLYYDEDFSRLIGAPEFAELRKKYPDPRPAPKGTGVVG